MRKPKLQQAINSLIRFPPLPAEPSPGSGLKAPLAQGVSTFEWPGPSGEEPSPGYRFEHGFLDLGQDPYVGWTSTATQATIAAMAASPLPVEVGRILAGEAPTRVQATRFNLNPVGCSSGHAMAWKSGLYGNTAETHNPVNINQGDGRMSVIGDVQTLTETQYPGQFGILQVGPVSALEFCLVLLETDGELRIAPTGMLNGGEAYRQAVSAAWDTLPADQQQLRKAEVFGMLVPTGPWVTLRAAGGIVGTSSVHHWAFSREDCTDGTGAHACLWTFENLDPGPPYNKFRVYEMSMLLTNPADITNPLSWSVNLNETDQGDFISYGPDNGELTGFIPWYASSGGTLLKRHVKDLVYNDPTFEHGGSGVIDCWYDANDQLVLQTISGTPKVTTDLPQVSGTHDPCVFDEVLVTRDVAAQENEYDFSSGFVDGSYDVRGGTVTTATYSIEGSDPGEKPTQCGNGTLQAHSGDYTVSGNPNWCPQSADYPDDEVHNNLAREDKTLLGKQFETDTPTYQKDSGALIKHWKLREGLWLCEYEYRYSTNRETIKYVTNESYGAPFTTAFYQTSCPNTVNYIGETSAIYKDQVRNALAVAGVVFQNFNDYSDKREVSKVVGPFATDLWDESAAIGETLDPGNWTEYTDPSPTNLPQFAPVAYVSAAGGYSFGIKGDAALPDLKRSPDWPPDPGDNTFRNVTGVGGV